jgi:hypothetical protein
MTIDVTFMPFHDCCGCTWCMCVMQLNKIHCGYAITKQLLNVITDPGLVVEKSPDMVQLKLTVGAERIN